MNTLLIPATLALALALAATPLSAYAQSPPVSATDLESLRQELGAMRAAYESRLQALEQRLKAAEAAAANLPPSPPPPSQATTAAGANAFNPAMSLILSGLYGRSSRDPAGYAVTGIPLPTSTPGGLGTRGFSLAESELGIAASIDPWWRGAANVSFHADNTVSVEEAFVQTTALNNGLTLKAGRFFSGVGYQNAQHAHIWDFVDAPLAYQAMLGGQYGDDGVQLSWLAPTDRYIELGIELGRGRSFPGTDTSRNGAGMYALTAHSGGDIGDSQSWRAGLSMLSARAADQGLSGLDASGNLVNSLFNGRTRVWVADAVWKWAPNGNATRTSLKLQGELLRATRDGSLSAGGGAASAYRVHQSGGYLQAVWQFIPRWRIGLRDEWLDAGRPDYGANVGLYASTGYTPRKDSLMLDYSASEFSRIRLQLANDRSQQNLPDRQLLLQYQMSLGAHGAHSF